MLPPDARAELQKVNIVPGAIVHCFCAYLEPDPKYKYMLLTHVDPDDDLVLCFLINSDIHPLIEQNPDKMAGQHTLSSDVYDFLDDDSHLDCSEVQEQIGYQELADHLGSNPRDFKGTMSDDDLAVVVDLVNGSRLITDADKEIILGSFA